MNWRRGTERWTNAAWLLVSYTFSILWHERTRFFTAVLAVACCAVLINMEWGLVLGIYSGTSIPIDQARAEIWVGAPRVPSVDGGRRISENHLSRLASQPEVERTESYILDYASWVKTNGIKENCVVIGAQLAQGSLGLVEGITPEQRVRLTEPGSVVVDAADLDRLGVRKAGDTAEILGHRVRVVGITSGLKGLSAPFVFCSLDTARRLLDFLPDQTTYLLASCRNPADAEAVARRLRAYPDLASFTRADFSLRTRLYWLTSTPGGLVTTFMAAISLLIGAVVTRQTLYAATLASLREFAVLRALGIPGWRIGTLVLGEALGVGLAGIVLAVPLLAALGACALWLVGARMALPWWLLTSVLAVTLLMALVSGIATLRSLRLMEPLTLLT